ncbi:MAG: 6-phosphofructokinase [Intrasporangiaceae bacterium]|nr:6-phosphofructokinase [Intrasporangiaceae bacterium]
MTDPARRPSSLAVLTSGGDAPGMNAAVRAVVRTAIHRGVPIHAIREGYQGLVDGGDSIQPFRSGDVGGIMHLGGTVIGTARCDDFRTTEGRQRAAHNLLERGIDSLVVVGGDGSLTGADIFRREWPDLLAALVADGRIDQSVADAHPTLFLVGLVGSIDNDMFGTDMTIGADTALHRITEAMDALHSTASSHQRSFVVEVMGRHCGYLAMMSGLAAGANWTFIPERPADAATWEQAMTESLRAGREQGRRQNMVVVAEGAHDTDGKPITAKRVQQVLEERLGEDTRVTILGHVQRGGAPSAFDRNLGTLCGHAAVELLLQADPDDEPQLIGIRENRIVPSPLMANVEQTKQVAGTIADGDYDRAMELRGGSFTESWNAFHTIVRATPSPPAPGTRKLRLAILHGGGPAPGMNAAVRAAVRLGIDAGHTMLGVKRGFEGLAAGEIEELGWMDITGWTGRGGAELATSRIKPDQAPLGTISRQLHKHDIDGLLMIGGWAGYEVAHALHTGRDRSGLDLPIVCLPASINNDLPGSELSIGADTALNSIISNLDKIKESAVSTHRCFVVETMGRQCGYLALMSGLASGAERLYLPEEGITLDDLATDVDWLRKGFAAGKRLGLVIRGEGADPIYTTGFIHALFERESQGLFDVRESILGHIQQGGSPSPFDRIQATRLAQRCINHLIDHAEDGGAGSAMAGLQGGRTTFTDLGEFAELRHETAERPKHQTWMDMRPIARVMARPELH